NNKMLDKENMSKEIIFESYNNDDILSDYLKYEFSKLSFDFCYENLKDRSRFFIYNEFIDQNKNQVNNYLSLIKKDKKEFKSTNSISKIILSPLSFFNYLKFSNNITVFSLVEHFLVSGGKNAIKFDINNLDKENLLDDNFEYPILHGLFYLRKINDKYISNDNIVEYKDFFVKDTKIVLPNKIELFTIIDKVEIIEDGNILYEIPWVKLNLNF
ncbi:MAG: hypothetical protein PF574_04735, partial [Candidatus Delongbacteria bacterium]|nr:hypothetical protein [Candidatus Delongbacteria bacterium]